MALSNSQYQAIMRIYNQRQFQNKLTYHTGAAISLVMMILILISVWIMNKFSDDEGGIII